MKQHRVAGLLSTTLWLDVKYLQVMDSKIFIDYFCKSW